MKLFTPSVLFISLTFATANAAVSATRLEQAQPPGVYPHNTYTASYVWTQTTVDENTHATKSYTHCTMVSSDGKGHLAIESPGLIEGIQVLDLPNGKSYHKSKDQQYVSKNSITTYSGSSYLNEVMFTQDSDVFNSPNPEFFGPAPISIGSKGINGYQCEGWRRTTNYKIEEWWFDKLSKCLVLMESKTNPNPKPRPLGEQALNWAITSLAGITPTTQTETERLDSLKPNALPASDFDIKNITPVRLGVSKLVEYKPDPNEKFEPNVDLNKVYREFPPPSQVIKLPPPEVGWKRITWEATKPYDLDFLLAKNRHFGREFCYSLDLPNDWSLEYGEGTTFIYGSPKKGAEIMLNYWGTTAFRKANHYRIPDNFDDDDPRIVNHGFFWLDGKQEAEYQMKKYCKRMESNHTQKLLSTKITQQTTRGGIPFWQADATYSENTFVFHGEKDQCFLVSDEGVNLSFESIPVTEKIVQSLCRK